MTCNKTKYQPAKSSVMVRKLVFNILTFSSVQGVMFHNRQTLNGTTYSSSHSIRFQITSRDVGSVFAIVDTFSSKVRAGVSFVVHAVPPPVLGAPTPGRPAPAAPGNLAPAAPPPAQLRPSPADHIF